MSIKSLFKEVAEKIKHDNKIEKELKTLQERGPNYTQREMSIIKLAKTHDNFLDSRYYNEYYINGYKEGYNDRDEHKQARYF